MRDNLWLKNRLEAIWHKYFDDIEQLNTIKIHFSRKAKRRLASIRQDNRLNKRSDTEIKITGYYKDPSIPEYIIDVTIAHELCHYAHGFASPLPQFSRFPHRGDLVDKELKKRGLGKMLKDQEKWLELNWNSIVNDEIFTKKHHYTKRKRRSGGMINFLRKLAFN